MLRQPILGAKSKIVIVPLPFGCLGDILGSGSVYPIQLSILMTFGKQLELSAVLVLEAGKIS